MKFSDLTRLRYFLSVAEHLSFRKAAETLNIAQPAISRSVKQLEEELGLTLFDRTTRRVTLTKAGKILAADTQQAITLLEKSIRHAQQLSSGKAGEIIVGYSAQTAYGPMADMIISFRNHYQDAVMSLYQMSSHEQIEAIESGKIDIGFMLSAACRAPLSYMSVYQERFILLVSRFHPLATRASVSLRELKDLPFVMGTQKRWETFRSLINNVCLQSGFLPVIGDEADDVPVLLQLIAMQRGITLYGAAIAKTVPQDVVAIPLEDTHCNFNIGIAWDRQRETPLMHDFIRFIEANSPSLNDQ